MAGSARRCWWSRVFVRVGRRTSLTLVSKIIIQVRMGRVSCRIINKSHSKRTEKKTRRKWKSIFKNITKRIAKSCCSSKRNTTLTIKNRLAISIGGITRKIKKSLRKLVNCLDVNIIAIIKNTTGSIIWSGGKKDWRSKIKTRCIWIRSAYKVFRN